jgi:lysozyme|tara:strand:- start:417 stop:842 length:426 start_codon:yes stop_codon:yes gene_type:complete
MNRLIEMLRRHEGVRDKVYMCSAGYETIGVGRNISESGLGLSDDEIDYLLNNDINRCREELSREYFWFNTLDVVRKEALIDLSFNIGQTKLRGFVKALECMAENNFEKAGEEFYDSKWAKQVGDRSLEICQMIKSGEYQNR